MDHYGWNFSAFGLIESVWNKIIGTTSKPSKPSQSLNSLPPQNNNAINKPPNTYLYTRPQVQQPPIAPPQQTPPLISNIISANKSNINNKSQVGGSAVITIHNLLRKTKLI